MNYHILTLFPDMVMQGLNTSIIGRAAQNELLTIEAVNIRDFSTNKHKKVDDYPYGGGAGMVMQAEPIYLAYESIKKRTTQSARVIYVTPQGSVFNQNMAKELAKEEDLIFLCGHYEGIDERVLEEIVTDYVSIGDYVLTGGELPAMVMIDTISRLVPGVLNNEDSTEYESFEHSLLEHPQYSRPAVWNQKEVPAVLLSGHHEKIKKWRHEQSLLRTLERRPDLLENTDLSKEELQMIENSKKGFINRKRYVILTSVAFAVGFFIFGMIVITMWKEMSSGIPLPLFYSFLLYGIMGGFLISSIISGILLFAAFINKRSILYKSLCIIFFPITYFCIVLTGIFGNIPYYIYNLVSLRKNNDKQLHGSDKKVKKRIKK